MIEIGKETVENQKTTIFVLTTCEASTLALNGLIGAGVPQDLDTHILSVMN